MNKTIKFVVDKENSGKRIDIYLSKKIVELSRSYIKKLIKEGQVKINAITTSASSTKIKDRDKIIVKIIEKKSYKLTPKKIKLDIVFEDKDILVINKPKGLVVHPGAGNYKNTLVNALLFKYKKNLSDINGALRPGIVHRIDKNTSGLVVIAKNNQTHEHLSIQFNKHSIIRVYELLIWGKIRPSKGKIETLITRSSKNRQMMEVSNTKGKKAITNYKTLEIYQNNNFHLLSQFH